MVNNFPTVGYTEFNKIVYDKLKYLYKLKNLDLKDFDYYNKIPKKYIAWNMSQNTGFVDLYFCNKSAKTYYTLEQLMLTERIYELW
jgi:hypothetical protein